MLRQWQGNSTQKQTRPSASENRASIPYLEGGVQGQIRPHEKIPGHDIISVGFTLEKCMSNKGVISTFKVGCSHLILEGPSQKSKIDNKRVISTFKFGYPRLTLKEGPKFKSDHAERFPAHDFLYVGLPSQTSRINNK